MVEFKLLLAASLLFVLPQGRFTAPGADNQPIDPYRIADRLYFVGTSNISAYLITTSGGDILIDAGYEETPPLIQASIEKLGFKIGDVKIVLNTQAHFDHAAGLAKMKQLTGARLMVSIEDAALIEAGGHGDYLFGDKGAFPPAKVDRRLKDGDTVRLGGVVLTAHVTGGHTKGCTTWTFEATDRGKTYLVVDVGGTTINPGTKVGGMATYPEITHDFQRTFTVLKEIPCDIFLGAHPSYYDGAKKLEMLRANPNGPNPFVDPAGYKAFVARTEKLFQDQLAKEKK
jgi:metallo-beta-lactamase class B